VLRSGSGTLGWLLCSPRLGFEPLSRTPGWGTLLLDRKSLRIVDGPRVSVDGRATWSVGALPPGTHLYLQAWVFDRAQNACDHSWVLRLEQP